MWMKIDDGLHNHRKTRAVTKSHATKTRDAAPMGLWVLAGSWAGQNGTEGWVPEDELDRWDDDWRTLMARLVKAGYWWPQERDGEPGFGFVDWHDYNDPADSASKAGTFGNHVRWHVNEGKVEPECQHCPREPDEPEYRPDDRGDIGGRSGGDSHPISGGESGWTSGAIALPEPEPEPEPHVSPNGETKSGALALIERDDVREVCEHLADRIAEDGSKRPTIGKGWLDAARLLLDKDGRDVAEVHAAIDWCQNHHFWRANILSMPKLREKFDQLRKQAIAERNQPSTSRNSEFQAQQERAMARAIERERQMGIR